MFGGIIEEIGTVRSAQPNRLVIQAAKVLEGTKLGDSISVNGACLTVTAMTRDTISVDLMPETLRRSNLGKLYSNTRVNLERALTLGARIGGHLVQGHTDGTGRVVSLVPDEGAILMTVSAPTAILRYLVEKGFVAVDGVSLTVTSVNTISFSVSLVAFTRQNSTLGERRPGEPVNIEVDIIAKYVAQVTQTRQSGITFEFLAEHGMLGQ